MSNGRSSATELGTPVSNGHDSDVTMGERDVVRDYDDNVEPPQAPARKTRMIQAFNVDPGQEAPKMRTIDQKLRPVASRRTLKTSSESTDDSNRRLLPPMNHKRTASGHTSQASASSTNGDAQAPQRRSERLWNQIRPSSSRSANPPKEIEVAKRDSRRIKATSTKSRSTTGTTVGRVVSGNRAPLTHPDRDLKEGRPASANSFQSNGTRSSRVSVEMSRDQEGLQWLLDLLAQLGKGYFALSRYNTHEALQVFASVPLQQRETPWVLAQIGKAYYEKTTYAEAEKYFSRIKTMVPSRMEDMEYYSTTLWHLKRDVDLAYLAHELVEADRLSPQAWCAVGNSFSLQRDHEQAVKCFKRATQLDPKFAYAFTLQGHEHVANEELDKAQYAYRMAISADPRHYNGWYGLGQVYQKYGKYAIAEKHYRSAAQINPRNAVLIVCIGVVSHTVL